MPTELGDATRPFLVLDHIVHDYRHTVTRREGDWERVDCRHNVAYGCGPLGDSIVKGLSFFVRLGGGEDHPQRFTNLCIGASEEVFHRVSREIPDRTAEIWGRQIRLTCLVYVVSGDIMISSLSFAACNSSKPIRSYYLVYDSAAKSFSLLPKLMTEVPPHCEKACNCVPVPVPHQDSSGNYTLAVMAGRRSTGPGQSVQPVICMASLMRKPETRSPPSLGSRSPWWTKDRVCANADLFRLEDVFLFKGKAVWSDVMNGIVYCDSSDLSIVPDQSQNQNPVVDFKFVLLPDEYRKRQPLLDLTAFHVYRTAHSVGDSIWFVCIKPSPDQDSLGETIFKVWSVDIMSESAEVKWKEHREFTLHRIWELDGFREAALPKGSEPILPFLRQEDDGVLYFMLTDPKRGGGCHIVGIDIRDRYVVRLASSRYIANRRILRPVVVPADFFSPRNTDT